MLTPWICEGCLRALSRPSRQPKLLRQARRWQTSGAKTGHENAVSPALLTRARSIAEEHSKISQQLAESFDTRQAKMLGQLSPVTNALKELETAQDALAELRSLTNSSDEELRSLAASELPSTIEQLHRTSQSLIHSLVPVHPFEQLPCLIEIRPGAGGDEGGLFVRDLAQMYRALCARLDLPLVVVSSDGGGGSDPWRSSGPLEEVILEVNSEGAYGIFRTEAGVHRVQRVPATEKAGRTHTSAASVLVLPSLPEKMDSEDDFANPDSLYFIDPSEVRTDIMKARGAGGQHVNTTDSAVRLTHIPTNTVVSMQDSRSQHQNREKAWRLLRSRVAQIRREAKEEEVATLRRSTVGVARMGRGDKIRTYNWGQHRVTDHRSGLTVNALDDVIEGGDSLGKVMESVRTWMMEKEVEGLIATS